MSDYPAWSHLSFHGVERVEIIKNPGKHYWVDVRINGSTNDAMTFFGRGDKLPEVIVRNLANAPDEPKVIPADAT